MHVMEAKLIRCERADRSRPLAVPVAAAAVATGLAVADLIAPGIGRRRSGARCIFPFRLGQKAIWLAGHSGQPRDVAAGIIPGKSDHRLFAATEAAIAHKRIAIAIRRAGVPLLEG